MGTLGDDDRLKRLVAAELPGLDFAKFDVYPGDDAYPLHLVGEVYLQHARVEVFDLEVHLPRAYPKRIPEAFETGGRIPRGKDAWHLHGDHSLCLGSNIEMARRFAARPDLLGYFETLVLPYLAGFLGRDEHGKPPQGDLDHGGPGILDDYRRVLGLNSRRAVLACLEMIRSRRIRGHVRCPCGSGRKLKRCHGWRLHAISNLMTPAQFGVDVGLILKGGA